MDLNKQHIANTTDHLPISRLLAFGMGGLIPIALFNIFGQLIQLVFNTGLGLSAFWLGVILMIPRLWDAFSDPLMGHISDNTQTKWGRRRPFIFAGAISVAISFVLIWWGPREVSDILRMGYVLFWALVFFTATTVFEIPHGALGMEMVKEQHVRTRLFSAKGFFGNVFSLGTPWLLWLATRPFFSGVGGNEIDGMRWVSLFVAAILIPSGIWWFIALKEPPIKKDKSAQINIRQSLSIVLKNGTFLKLVFIFFILAMGFNFVGLLNYYISFFYLYGGDKATATFLLGINGTVWGLTAMAAVVPLNIISPKLGKRRTLTLSILLMCAAQLSKIVCYNPELPYLVLIPTVMLSAGMLMFFTLGPSMLGDLCDEVELNTGRRTDGSFYAMFWWFIKMGTACASLVTGLLIMVSSFDEKQPSLMDSVAGPLRELAVAGEVVEKGINFNVITLAGAVVLIGLIVLGYALKSLRGQGGKLVVNLLLGFGLMAGGGALGWYEAVREAKEPVTVDLVEKLTAVTDAVEEVDAYFAGRELGKNADVEHYAQLRRFLADIRTGTDELIAAEKAGALPLEQVREKASDMTGLALKAMQQNPTAMFRLRAIEISLPLLMSVVSLFLTFRYPLTGKRIEEIEAELKRRKENNSNE